MQIHAIVEGGGEPEEVRVPRKRKRNDAEDE